MNMPNLMMQAKKMQKDIEKTQKELENTEYEGSSSCVELVLNGNKELKSIKLNFDDDFNGKDDVEMLEDMILVAFNDAQKKVDADKNKKLGKYGSNLSGLM